MSTILEKTIQSIPHRGLPEDPIEEELESLWPVRDRAGKTYDLYLERISRNPVLRSHATGKYTMLPWSRVIELGAGPSAGN